MARSPSAMNTTIYANPANEAWKRSISHLYGSDASPRNKHGDEHRMKTLAGEPQPLQAGDQARGGQAERQPDRHLQREVLHDDPDRRVKRSSRG